MNVKYPSIIFLGIDGSVQSVLIIPYNIRGLVCNELLDCHGCLIFVGAIALDRYPQIAYCPFNTITLKSNSKLSQQNLKKTITLRNLAHTIYRDFFSAVKSENFIRKKKDIFDIFAQSIHCGYT